MDFNKDGRILLKIDVTTSVVGKMVGLKKIGSAYNYGIKFEKMEFIDNQKVKRFIKFKLLDKI